MQIPPGTEMTFLGLSWSSGQPTVAMRLEPARLDPLPAKPTPTTTATPTDQPLVGLHLAFRVEADGRRWCLGADGPGRSVTPCLRLPEAHKRTCVDCSVKNARFAGALHHAHTGSLEPAPDVARHLDQPNRLYLAAFRDGSIKVGTSTEQRSAVRLLEQGAWMATFVASTTNGIEVRVVEDLITEQLGLPQSVAASRKLTGLSEPRDNASLEHQLSVDTQRVHTLLSPMLNLGDPHTDGVTLTNEPWRNPALVDPTFANLHRYPHRLDTGEHLMRIEAACGGSVAFRRTEGGDVFVADIRQLFGLTLRSVATDIDVPAVSVQDSLF